MKNVSVITINFNTANNTQIFLDSLQKVYISGFLLTVIVVDNGSTDPFVLQDTQKKDNVYLVRSAENTGFSGGNNIGIKKALELGADYMLIVNNDTIMDTKLINNLIKILESDEKIGLVTPKIYFAKGHEFHKERYKKEELGKVFWYAGGSIDWNNVVSIHRGVDEVDHGQYDKIEKIDFATGCCMMVKKEVFEKVGLFDDEYFLYYEDADLNERIIAAGYNLYYVPSAVLVHMNAASSGGAGKGNTLQDYFITRNRMLFGMTYASLRTKIALIRESIRLLLSGRKFQKLAIRDYYLHRLGKGTFFTYK